MKDRNYWKERLPLIQAYVDGHEIGDLTGASTSSFPSIEFDADVSIYRILPKPDPFKELKEAYARGKKIEYWEEVCGNWIMASPPTWAINLKYRIKPKEDPYKKFKDALKEGKKVQCYYGCGNWITKESFRFDFPPERYRIKPEPRLIPFTIDDATMFRDKWIKRNDKIAPDGPPNYTWRKQVDAYEEDGIWLGQWVKFDYMLKYYVFEDGTPFGKYVECE